MSINNRWLLALAVSSALLLPACGGAAPEPPPAPVEAPAESAAPTNTAAPVEAAVPTEAAPPTEVPTAVVAATEAATAAAAPAAPTEEPAAEVAAADVDWLTNEGQTEEGFAFLGNPDAPIVLQDYSDFL